MNTRRDPDAVLAAWLDEGPDELPEQDRRAIVNSTRLMTQRRGGIALPWRDTKMNGSLRIALGAAAVLIAAVGGFALLGPGLSGVGGTPTPTPPTGGQITLTDTGCTWVGNPMTVSKGPILMEFRNITDGFATFDLHGVVAGRTWDEGVAFVDELNRRIAKDELWPDNHISDFNRLTELTAGSTTRIEVSMPYFEFTPRTHGILCGANTSPTGDVIGLFLVGPLEYEP